MPEQDNEAWPMQGKEFQSSPQRNFSLPQAQLPSSTEPFLSTSISHHVELTSLFTCSLKFVSPEATVLVTLGIYRLLSVIKAKAHWVHSPRGSLGWSEGLSPASSSWASAYVAPDWKDGPGSGQTGFRVLSCTLLWFGWTLLKEKTGLIFSMLINEP